MVETTYKRFYVAQKIQIDGSPEIGDGLSEWILCRDSDEIPRHWASYGEAMEWTASQDVGEFVIITKSVRYSSDKPIRILDIDSLFVAVNL